MQKIELGVPDREVSLGGNELVLIAGPCVIESENHATAIARQIHDISERQQIPFIFKASFDKANRTSGNSYRGPGLTEGLRILAAIKQDLGVPILTDIHEPTQAKPVSEVADIIQIPAFLSRQTDLITAAARTGCSINLKKGQFLAPDDMRYAIEKVVHTGNHKVFVTERGTTFGYHNLVVDMRSFQMLRKLGCPVVFDITHSLQLPGGGQGASSGQAEFITSLASAGVAAGVDGVFLEVHDAPKQAKSDGENACPLDQLESLLIRLKRLSVASREDD